MSDSVDLRWLVRRLASGLFLVLLATATVVAAGCQQPAGAPPTTTTIAGDLTAAERTNAVRARLFAERAARYRAAAARQREQAAAYARWTPRPGSPVTTNWNEKLKASCETRAVAADQIATNIQTYADFHAAEAAKEGGR